uniref:Uncharacterized protein n=1 Tax=Prolemur simus TaxID=1328070 RepID=A0A8C9AHM8_PROSS
MLAPLKGGLHPSFPGLPRLRSRLAPALTARRCLYCPPGTEPPLAPFSAVLPLHRCGPEESLLPRDRRCGSRPFPRPWSLKQLQVWERPVALEAELALTLKVLGAVADTALGDVLDQPLHTLSYLRSQLQACGPAPPTTGPRPQGHLQRWVDHPRLPQASVVLELFCLFMKCVTSGDPSACPCNLS